MSLPLTEAAFGRYALERVGLRQAFESRQSGQHLDEMVRRTTAVATTVGPYLRYGLPLAAACADSGTHYADLTGEPLFMRRTTCGTEFAG